VKPLVDNAVWVVMLGAVAAAVVFAIALATPAHAAALIGVGLSSLVGFGALVLKSQTSPQPGPAGVKQLLAVQAKVLGLRLLAAVVGSLAVLRQGLEPIAFVLAFAACALVQQVLEMKVLLAANASKPSGVTP
jgi:hypothetical protein